jgi:hypothetical protein
MAVSKRISSGNTVNDARVGQGKNLRDPLYEKAQRLALDQQNELVERAQAAVGDEPGLSFNSSMSRSEVRSRFTRMVQRSREAVIA